MEVYLEIFVKLWKYNSCWAAVEQLILLVLLTFFLYFQIFGNKVDQICNKNQLWGGSYQQFSPDTD